jgi:hypothetical protein
MDRINDVITRIARPELINYIFIGFLSLFLVDNIFNSTVRHMPIFVAGAIFLSLFFLAYLIKDYKKHMWLLTGITLMFLIMIVNSFKDGFHVQNFSDWFFFVMYVLSYLAYFSVKQDLKYYNVHIFIVSTILLFIIPLSLGMFGVINPKMVGYSFKPEVLSEVSSDIKIVNKSYFAESSVSFNEINEISAINEEDEENIKKDQVEEIEKDPLYVPNPFRVEESFLDNYLSFSHDSDENHRTFLKGFFRIPHVASYFFGFSAIFLAFLAFKKQKYLFLIPVILLLVLSLYTGVRSFMLALIISVFIYLMQKKYLSYFLIAAILGLFVILFRNQIADILEGTFLQQHFSIVTTLFDNFGRFSRVMIWYSWFMAVSDFHWYEFLIGKSYLSGLVFNENLFGQQMWFHSDILNMFYCYGIIGISVYLSFLIRIFKDCKQYIQGNIFIFLFFSTSVVISFINGFYYYFTVFLMYMFILMVASESKKIIPIVE